MKASPLLLALALVAALPAPVATAQGPAFVFIEPDPQAPAGSLPAFRAVTEQQRLAGLHSWTSNEAAGLARIAYRTALAIVSKRTHPVAPDTILIALTPDSPATLQGLRLRDGTIWRAWPRAPFLRLEEKEPSFGVVLLHETGHACLMLLAGDKEIPGRAMAPIPHAVTALTDRTTAFGEGFSTALEAVLAQRAVAPAFRSQYSHDNLQYGVISRMQGEYFRPSAELATYAQALSRHQDVRDNLFAFSSAFSDPDYLRVQLDPARDLASLRDANQLLQSQGFAASVVYSLLQRGSSPSVQVLQERLGTLMRAIHEVLRQKMLNSETPVLVEVVQAMARQAPEQRHEVFATLLDLSRGVLVDREAASLWRQHYLAALRQDLEGLNHETINSARQRWLQAVLADPSVLTSLLGPQLRCTVPAVTVRLPGMGIEAPLGFDLNTAERGVLRLVPKISEDEVSRWLSERQRAPFASAADFTARVPLRPDVASSLQL